MSLNLKKLKLFEEDYSQRKNQVDQIKKTLKDYNSKIQQLTNQKKQCFRQINQITREMAGDTRESKNDIEIINIGASTNLSNAEKIKNLQKKAKEIQSEISIITSKKSQTQLKFEELDPIFASFERDYQSLLELINNDEQRINELQSELKNKIKDTESAEIKDINLDNFKSLRSSIEIENDIEKVESELNKARIHENYFNHQNPSDLSLIIRRLTEFDKKVKNNDSDIIININEKDISKCFEQFNILEKSLRNIESLLNRFLSEINIKSQIKIIVSDDLKYFLIDLEFLRNDKDKVKFEELTTPEKIFFIIAFYISIKLHLKIENIIFSNVSLLSNFNKAGSIHRAIRKILPIFEMEDTLSKFNLIFILSYLELKKEIKNLKVITI